MAVALVYRSSQRRVVVPRSSSTSSSWSDHYSSRTNPLARFGTTTNAVSTRIRASFSQQRQLGRCASTNTNEEMMSSPSTEDDHGTSTTLESSSPSTLISSAPPPPVIIDPKDAIRLFGRLAEKYIALDSSGGSCCYSACADCEYRLPGGGYIMADQTAARPKWIPCYETRPANHRIHTSQWSTHLFTTASGTTTTAVTQTEFVERLVHQMNHLYAPPLASGGPYVGASDASLRDTVAAEHLFRVLMGHNNNNEDGTATAARKLTKHKMSVRLKELAGGEEGLMWPAFARAMGCS